ncbi:sugar isomerase [candidate division KSB1 bacterium]|nr:sugar isomerase [candidate division KSB1 bacterium]RQW04311.1 MAG: sugar isomerase [candidate division KSB1 bacterium]
MLRTGSPLTVQPILLYSISSRREQTSWRSWGGLHTEEDAAEEVRRISAELERLQCGANFELTIKPVIKVRNVEEAERVRNDESYDVPIVYAASGWTTALEACFSDGRPNLIFLRHKSGPIYLWYEIVHNRFLRQGNDTEDLDEYRYPSGMTIDDVVVDDYEEMLTKLRALYGVHNFMGRKIVALGGSSGWCNEQAPEIARNKFSLDIVGIEYADLAKRIKSARSDAARMQRAQQWAQRYLNLPETTLQTHEQFVINAFLLYDIFKDYLTAYDAAAFTIQDCMGTVMPISETTACLPLSLLNDEGYLAFCESDFNVIPSGILLHYISGKPVFLNDPTFPHHGMVTVAHCTAPRRLDGEHYAHAQVVTHFESDYGATPKVELPIGTPFTMVCPDAGQKKWLGFTGTIVDNPFYDICRSQFDIAIDGDWKKLLRDHRGFHWMMTLGDHSQEMAHACPKIGVEWLNVSQVG